MSIAADPRSLVDERFERSAAATERFFADFAGRVPEVCVALADRFRRGGRLLAFGTGAAATDAHHVSVEFVHPVLVGKRALPALALTCDAASSTAGGAGAFAAMIGSLGRPGDMALAISRSAPEPALDAGLAAAREKGMLTIALAGAGGTPVADFAFVVPETDPLIVQEVQETLYHVFWELVHVFLDREAP